jgi:hypothetical protein
MSGVAAQRDRPAATLANDPTGRVSGVVTVSATADEPVRRAVVSLIPAGGGDGIATVTDDEGRFAVGRVPDGRYAVVAEKPAYLTAQYGAKRPGRAGIPVVVAKGQAVESLRIVLPKGAVITGRLVQPTGAPVRGVQVLAIPVSQIAAGGRFDTRARPFYSDDLGVYRIYGLAPGEYVVAALPSQGFGEVERRTATEYEEAVRALSSGADRARATVSPSRGSRFGYAPTYYPGTASAADAPPIRVTVGEVRDGIDIPVEMFRMSQISGTIVDSSGIPTAAVLLSVTTSGPPLPFGGSSLRLTSPDAQGRFTISNVPPGVYTLTARGGGVTVNAQEIITVRNAEQTDWAMARVAVAGDDIDGVTLSLQPGYSFSGRVEATGEIAPGALNDTRIALVTPGADPAAARAAVVDERGAFSVTGVHPETYQVVVTLPPALTAKWAVRAVLADGIDLRDQPLTFERGSIRDVAIRLTDRRSEVAGTLSTANGMPASDYFIIIFPEARALWHPVSPRVRVVRPDTDGTFSARDLPAGAYRIVAVNDVEGDEWRQASFLESLLGASMPLTVKDGATTRQDLRIQ